MRWVHIAITSLFALLSAGNALGAVLMPHDRFVFSVKSVGYAIITVLAIILTFLTP